MPLHIQPQKSPETESRGGCSDVYSPMHQRLCPEKQKPLPGGTGPCSRLSPPGSRAELAARPPSQPRGADEGARSSPTAPPQGLARTQQRPLPVASKDPSTGGDAPAKAAGGDPPAGGHGRLSAGTAAPAAAGVGRASAPGRVTARRSRGKARGPPPGGQRQEAAPSPAARSEA